MTAAKDGGRHGLWRDPTAREGAPSVLAWKLLGQNTQAFIFKEREAVCPGTSLFLFTILEICHLLCLEESRGHSETVPSDSFPLC